jgi:hypothetical protein
VQAPALSWCVVYVMTALYPVVCHKQVKHHEKYLNLGRRRVE